MTMTIRRATVEDIEAIVAMGLRFQATTGYAAHLRATPDTLRDLSVTVLQSADAACWLAERDGVVVGMIAAGLYTQPMSGERIGSEICWWMDEQARGGRTALRLIRAAEEWARGAGAVAFQMMAPTPAVGHFYEVLDYEPIETHYMRRFP
jgi:GNAT superfamily N-acetyltransferase